MEISNAPIFKRPYPASWFDRLLAWLDALPGPAWLYLVALFLVQWLAINALLWANDKLPLGTFELARAFTVVLVPYTLGFWLYMRGIVTRALALFCPLLQLDDSAHARLEYEILTLPARPTLALTLIFFAANLVFYALLPPAVYLEYAPSRENLLVQYGIVAIPAAVFSLVGVYRAFYVLRGVNHIHRMASAINLYQAPPLYAFSGVTATIGIGLLVPAYYIFAALPEMTFGSPLLMSSLVVTVLLAIAAFVFPLREMHNRIVRERARLLVEANQRFESLVARVHQGVDSNEYQQCDGARKAFSIAHASNVSFGTCAQQVRVLEDKVR